MPARSFRLTPGGSVIAASAIGAALVAVACCAPRFWLWPALGMPLRDLASIQPELHRAYFALQQLHDPWQKIDSDVNRVIEWRLLWPVIGHYTGMSPSVYLALPFVGCLATLGATAMFVWRATRDNIITASATLLVATASWFFVSTGWLAYFDSWLMLALLLASFARGRWVLFTTALFAPWVDERFLLALPLCLGLRALGFVEPAPDKKTLWADAKYLFAGIAPYVLLRLGAELFHVRSTSESYWAKRSFPPASLDGMLLGLWHGLRLGWFGVLFALIFALRGKHSFAVVAIAASLLVNICIADDISRSSSVAMPVLITGIVFLAQKSPSLTRRTLPWVCAGNLLLPAAHIIAGAISDAELYHSVPIHNLHAEIDHARHPPAIADPAFYTQRGLEAFAAGENEIARNQFDLALRFDPEFAPARAHRGIVLFLTGKRAEGTMEINRALDHDPSLFDVRLQRATFRQQVGDLPGALADAQEALRTMPADWPRRREAEQYARALAAQIGPR